MDRPFLVGSLLTGGSPPRRRLRICPRSGNSGRARATVVPDAGYGRATLARIEETCGTDSTWTFTASDLDAATDDLRGRGVEVDEAIRDTAWGRFGLVRNLDGDALLRNLDGDALRLSAPADPLRLTADGGSDAVARPDAPVRLDARRGRDRDPLRTVRVRGT